MPVQRKKRGGGKPWATEEQQAWLFSKLPGYQATRKSADAQDYTNEVIEEWFVKWPLGKLDPKVDAKAIAEGWNYKQCLKGKATVIEHP
jgi:hypothetical protein